MKPLLLAVFSVLASPFCARPEVLAGWSTNLIETFQTAREQKKPVLLYFTAAWCSPCKMMARTTLQDALVLRELDRFARVVVDVDANQVAARQHHVEAMPTFVVSTADGDEVLLATGYMDALKFHRWLTNGLAAHAAFLERRQKLLAQQQVLAAALRGTDPAARDRAVKQLLDLCGEREPAPSRFAVEQLKPLAKRNPALLLPGLNHPRLATRIHVANLLREALGEAFDFDPWEPAAKRQRVIAIWQDRLQAEVPK
jgi:thiol-disulfide isomerase/thioredoxin